MPSWHSWRKRGRIPSTQEDAGELVGRQQRQEIWDNTDLVRPSDLSEAGGPMVQAPHAVQQRGLFVQRPDEPSEVLGDRRRHA